VPGHGENKPDFRDLGLDPDTGLCHYREYMENLCFPASREDPDQGLAQSRTRLVPNPGLDVGKIVNFVQQGMAEKFGLDAVLGVKLLFKRENHDHPVHTSPEGIYPIGPPRPDLGRYIIENGDPRGVGPFGQLYIEIGVIDQYHPGISSPADIVLIVPKNPVEKLYFFSRLHQTDGCGPVDVGEYLHTRIGHPVTPHPGNPKPGVSGEEFLDQAGSVPVARFFSGYD